MNNTVYAIFNPVTLKFFRANARWPANMWTDNASEAKLYPNAQDALDVKNVMNRLGTGEYAFEEFGPRAAKSPHRDSWVEQARDAKVFEFSLVAYNGPL